MADSEGKDSAGARADPPDPIGSGDKRTDRPNGPPADSYDAAIAQPPAFPRRRFVAVAVVLALLLPLTWFARDIYVDRVAAASENLKRNAVTEALNQIEVRFNGMQTDLLDRARNVANAPDVIRGLRERARYELSQGPAIVVEYFSELDIPQQNSVELYDYSLSLVAWKGFSMPLDSAPSSHRFLGSFQTAIATDADLRQALVVWWPVHEGNKILGVVRVMHLIGYDAPVHNEYLRDISLADRWQRLTHLPVEVSFEAANETVEPAAGRSRLLQGADGTVLGRVVVEPPSTGELTGAAHGRFNDMLALWAVLLLFWLMGGLWHSYHRCLEKAWAAGCPLWKLGAWFAGVAAGWWTLRYALLNLNVPSRWQAGKAPLAPLFDPIHFASGFGGGLLRSTGDFFITAIFFLIFAAACAQFAHTFRQLGRDRNSLRGRLRHSATRPISLLKAAGTIVGAGLLIQGLTIVLSLATRRAVLDSTFDYFARKGLLPEPLLLIVLCSLLLVTIGIILTGVAIVWTALKPILQRRPEDVSRWTFWLSVVLAAGTPVIILYALTPLNDIVAWPVSLSFLAVSVALAAFLMLRQDPMIELLILRSVLPSIFFVTVLLYPLVFSGMDAQRRIQMMDAAGTFAEGRDPRVLFAIEQLLQEIRQGDDIRAAFSVDRSQLELDSLAMAGLRGSLLSSLPAYDVSLTIFDQSGTPIGRYYDTGQSLDAKSLDEIDQTEFSILQQMYEEGGTTGVMVEPVTGRREPDRFQYEGVAPVYANEGDELLGWVMSRAEPQTMLREGGTPFPRVLLPSGSYDDLYANLSIAEFRDGVLVRSMGRDFGRYRLSDDVRLSLAAESDIWRMEMVEERVYQTYYRRHESPVSTELDRRMLPTAATSIVGIRVPSINTFDHLYYLLRLTVCGLLVALPLYIVGLIVRYRAGQLPAPRVRFRDKVLNAFLGVGIISVAAVGFVGLEVVTGENERAVQSWLRQHLERVEETLALDVRGEEMPYRVLERSRVDSLAARVGLDLTFYREYELKALSRPQLLRERLIDRRLPIEAYKALYFDGYRFIYTDERVGNFTYTTGFRALPDEQGRPQYVVSVPTLPEQERIEEERARTVAYLFGSLLLLLLVVMLTAALLANAISRPIARLRSGLKAVAAGRFERMIPVDSRDEIGELVQTFNEMQEQLAESRRKLAQQERQLAWREMARQVAHEIKNPLTPMKLSVQHLRRAFESGEDETKKREKFGHLFRRITTTLIEQIDTLARIANEFHSFARMPSRIVERLDLNAVAEEAVALMQEESEVEIHTDLCTEKLMLDGDREELRRDFINLIKNAIQAIPEDEKGRVDVRTRLDLADNGTQWAHCEVSDNGTGVEEDVRDKIFEPNFSTKTSGTGLGLAIVKKSVEEHRGDIGFETALGEGSTFWIRLPLAED